MLIDLRLETKGCVRLFKGEDERTYPNYILPVNVRLTGRSNVSAREILSVPVVDATDWKRARSFHNERTRMGQTLLSSRWRDGYEKKEVNVMKYLLFWISLKAPDLEQFCRLFQICLMR